MELAQDGLEVNLLSNAFIKICVWRFLSYVHLQFHIFILLHLHNSQTYKDLYLTNEQVLYLNCVWEANKFVLHEMISKFKNKEQFMNVETGKD